MANAYTLLPMAILTMANPTTATPTKAIIEYFKPDVLVGAVGRAPNCFTKEVVQAMVAVQAPYLYPYPWP